MSACARHPSATRHGAQCAACLLETALAPMHAGGARWLTIQLPLGATPRSSVVLVKEEGADRLLRLKTWHIAAPPDFLSRVERLDRQLGAWSHAWIPAPLAACVDAYGRPAVLSEFRRGIPIIERVRSEALPADAAERWLRALRGLVRLAHERGLVHGAITGGNVLVDTPGEAISLLDFGHAALVAAQDDDAPRAAADLAGFDRLVQAVRDSAGGRPPRP